jgi:hypothetical protein
MVSDAYGGVSWLGGELMGIAVIFHQLRRVNA